MLGLLMRLALNTIEMHVYWMHMGFNDMQSAQYKWRQLLNQIVIYYMELIFY